MMEEDRRDSGSTLGSPKAGGNWRDWGNLRNPLPRGVEE